MKSLESKILYQEVYNRGEKRLRFLNLRQARRESRRERRHKMSSSQLSWKGLKIEDAVKRTEIQWIHSNLVDIPALTSRHSGLRFQNRELFFKEAMKMRGSLEIKGDEGRISGQREKKGKRAFFMWQGADKLYIDGILHGARIKPCNNGPN